MRVRHRGVAIGSNLRPSDAGVRVRAKVAPLVRANAVCTVRVANVPGRLCAVGGPVERDVKVVIEQGGDLKDLAPHGAHIVTSGRRTHLKPGATHLSERAVRFGCGGVPMALRRLMQILYLHVGRRKAASERQ